MIKNYSRFILHGGKGSSEGSGTLDVWHIGNGRKGFGRCVGVGGHSNGFVKPDTGLSNGLGGLGGELNNAILFVTALRD